MSVRRFRSVVVLGLLVTAVPGGAQEFPSKPIRFIVPFPPSGAVDVLARTLGPPMSRALGQNVVVENRAGGNTVIAGEIVARAPADGHTLLLMAPSFTINPFVRSKLPFDVLKDFSPVTLVANSALLIAIHPSLPARDTKELIALARANPGKLTFATASIIGGQRIAGELFKDAAKIDIVNIPYNGGAPATMATVGGHTTMLVTNIIEAAPQVIAGKLRGIAVTTIQRSQVLPQVPTVAEAGFPGFDAGNWFGALVRSGTPKPALDRLNAEIIRALDQPDVRETLGRYALIPAPMTPERFGAFIRTEMERNGRIIRKLELKME
jgi:tripartite-type tricarboxylate transporter receptor subunit TctC